MGCSLGGEGRGGVGVSRRLPERLFMDASHVFVDALRGQGDESLII